MKANWFDEDIEFLFEEYMIGKRVPRDYQWFLEDVFEEYMETTK